MTSAATHAKRRKIVLFDRSEYLARIARVKTRMAAAGIDVLFIASPANQFWLTGYDGWSFYTPQMVVLSIADEEPLWFGRNMDAVGAAFTLFMTDERIIPYPDEYVGSRQRHPMQYLAEIANDRGWGKKRIGVEKDDYYYTAHWHEVLTNKLPNAKFVDAFLLVNWCRLKKSEREIQYLTEAGTISSAALQAAVDACKVGVRQCDVMAELYKVTIGGTQMIGGTFPCKPPNAMVGEICSAPHLSWSDRPLQRGEIYYIEQAGVRHRYHAPLSRCIYLGKPSHKMLDTAAVIVEGLDAALAAVKPGIALEAVENAWRRVIAKHGIAKDSRLGYPVGIGFPPTWGELTCSIRKGDRTVLEPGMSFHCIPALWLEDYGLVVSESFVVTNTGANTFAKFPRKLFTIDA